MTCDLAILGGRLVLADGVHDGSLHLADGRIAAVGDLPPTDGPTLDAHGLFVAPGFVDLQLNGGFGHDFTADPDSIWEVAQRLPRYGVTSFLPTVVTAPAGTIAEAQRALRSVPPAEPHATPLGLHLEGPMLSPQRAGAHRPEHLALPADVPTDDWSPESGVAMVTIAPELPGAVDTVAELVGRGVIVSLGHSDASSEVAAEAFDAGARVVTHLYNAMSPLRHRRPGLVGAALARREVVAGLIVDGVHVEPEAVAAAWNAKGPQATALVTDAGAALGMPDGTYSLGDRKVTVSGSEVRLPNGTLAGTNLTMPLALRNLVEFTGCGISEAVTAATSTPARVLGLASKGTLTVGADADIVLFGDDFQIAHTLLAGAIAFHR